MVAKKVEPGGPPWKAKHDGIPQNWKHIGEGGNAHVWADKRLAIKRLKASVSLESRKRFEREAWIFDELSRETDLSVVPVLEVRERADQLEIVTELLDGNLAL